MVSSHAMISSQATEHHGLSKWHIYSETIDKHGKLSTPSQSARVIYLHGIRAQSLARPHRPHAVTEPVMTSRAGAMQCKVTTLTAGPATWGVWARGHQCAPAPEARRRALAAAPAGERAKKLRRTATGPWQPLRPGHTLTPIYLDLRMWQT